MATRDFWEVVDEIIAMDPRYGRNAYAFVRKALDYTVQKLAERSKRTVGHVSGKQLMEGFRIYTLEQFGPMAPTVLESWGVRETEDVGNIVFHLVEAGVLGKTEKDSIEDFKDVYSFAEAFVKPYCTKKKKRLLGKNATDKS